MPYRGGGGGDGVKALTSMEGRDKVKGRGRNGLSKSEDCEKATNRQHFQNTILKRSSKRGATHECKAASRKLR